MRLTSMGSVRLFWTRIIAMGILAIGVASPAFAGDWWYEAFEAHGFITSKSYFRSANFSHKTTLSSWRTELNLETAAHLYQSDDFRWDMYAVLRPTYDAIYEIEPDLWGSGVKPGERGTAPSFPDDPTAGAGFFGSPMGTFAGVSGKGGSLDSLCMLALGQKNCGGGRVDGEFTVINSDTATLFDGKRTPAVSIDDVVFFGRVTAPVKPRGNGQGRIGGNATGNTYADLRDNFPVPNGGLPPNLGLDASLALAVANGTSLGTPLNAYQGAIGDASSLKRGSIDINRREDTLKFDCFDNAHPWCFVREAYFEFEYKDTFVRLGKQQIVWGKTDAFRLQDKINPIDFGYHNVFPDLEERRIPQLALDVIHSFGDVGPFQDVSVELAWVFDRFVPDQFGQCGEPYAFTAACESRADAGGHQLFNFSLAQVDEVPWNIQNTEPGIRVEFRLPEPSIAFSLSAFYTRQDTPVAKFSNHYSTDNPNPAVLLFLQGLANAAGPVAGTIDALSAGSQGFAPPAPYSGTGGGGPGVWITGFDPYDHNAAGAPINTLAAANGDLQNAWYMLTNVLDPANGGCAVAPGEPFDPNCGGAISIFGLPWSASEATLEYPRVWALGASADYQIPGIDTVLRVEIAADIDRDIQDTSVLDGVSESNVFQAAIGLDRSTFIPFVNPDRTAFMSAQTFFEHIIDYRDKSTGKMVPYETQIISTVFMQNYWRNDSVILTNFAAYDWNAQALIMGPSLRYVYDEHFFFDIGINVLWGKKRTSNIRNLCGNNTLSCLGDPTTWQDGNWQTLNAGLDQKAESPFWSRESFADKFMRNRDEFWIGMTYQF